MSDQNLTVRIEAEAGPLELDVRHFSVQAEINRPYQIDLVALSSDAAIDLDGVIGLTATFTLQAGARGSSPILTDAKPRKWTGVVAEAAHVTAEEDGLSTYRIRIVPQLWLLTQRTDIRIFQHLSELEIVLRVLDSWEIPTTVRADRDAHRRREYRTQYEETDFDFVNRLMEEAGISYFFDSSEEGAGKMIIADAPHRATPRERALTYQETPLDAEGMEYATAVELVRRVAPGKVALVDHDFRRPTNVPIVATAQGGKRPEQRLEMFDYRDGHFLYVAGDAGDPEDPGDQRGPARTDDREAQTLAGKRLRAFRSRAKETHFGTNAGDVDVGSIVKITGHSRADLGEDGLLVTEITLTGGTSEPWHADNLGTSAADVYRPPLRTPRPVASGVESATVVGPDSNKSYKDRHGRIFVHFHWDRDQFVDEYSTCWMHVSQPWGGAGYGASMMPRPGQEVIVAFFGSDPDRPVVVGRYHTSLQTPAFRYPSPNEEGGMVSWSDDGSGGSNKMTWSDRAGREMQHFQAQRDQTTLVKRNCGTTVQNDQSTAVGNDRTIRVHGNETRAVDGSRGITVGQHQVTRIGQTQVSEVGNCSVNRVTNVLATTARSSLHETSCITAFRVGASAIVIQPNQIIIQSAKVLINPGPLGAPSMMPAARCTPGDPMSMAPAGSATTGASSSGSDGTTSRGGAPGGPTQPGAQPRPMPSGMQPSPAPPGFGSPFFNPRPFDLPLRAPDPTALPFLRPTQSPIFGPNPLLPRAPDPSFIPYLQPQQPSLVGTTGVSPIPTWAGPFRARR
jgi:type VI secretion system secreted protein VgrG